MENARRFEELWIWQQAGELVIAEGFERQAKTEFGRFLDIAKGPCGEVRSLYYTAEDLNNLDPATAHERRIMGRKISCGIASLAKLNPLHPSTLPPLTP